MTDTEAEPGRATPLRVLVVSTVWIALVTGFVEGPGSVLLMRLGRRPGAWWDLLWISPAFDLVLFGATGAALVLLARLLKRPALPLVLPVYGFLTASIWLGLALPYQVHIAALLLLSAGLGFQGARLVQRRLDRVVRFWERTLPAVVGLAAIAFLALVVGRPVRERMATASLPEAAAGAPDVVLIVVDALRADHLSTHGYERDTSPELQRLASQGVLFTAAFSASPYTGPSHASLLTGVYPSEHGLQWIERRGVLSEEHRRLPEALGEAGYRTAAISGNRFWFTREQGFGQGFLRFVDNYRTVGDAVMRTAYGRKLDELVLPRLFEDYPWRLKADEVTDRALDWAGSNGDHPFFLMLNYFDVHDPYFPPAPYREMYSDEPQLGRALNTYHDIYHPDLTPEQLRHEIAAYDGGIRFVDTEIARLMEGLRGRTDGRDLLVVVTADHGEAFNEHGSYIHANSLYEEEIHVPLIVWSPGRVPAGVVSESVVSNAAVPATVLDLLGLPAEASFEVPSLTGVWSGGADAGPRPPAFAEMEHWPWNLEWSPSHYGGIQAVIDGDEHLIVNDSLGVELYHWRTDAREADNLLDAEPDRAAELEVILHDRLPLVAERAP